MRNPAEILIVEDDAPIRKFLRASLSAEDYRVHEAMTASEGMAQWLARQPDLVLLDLGLPDQDGFTVIRQIRQTALTPIIVLSARGREKDKVEALDLGADDFVAKPFAIGELLARIRALLRRAARIREGVDGATFRATEIEVDLAGRVVRVRGEEVHLTPIEFRLLQALVRHAGKVVTHRQLLVDVWGPQHSEQAQYLRVYMGQLRRKLERDSARPRFLITEPGVGYRLVEG
ncbi:MAG: response regulator [Bryobacteraceae bacterium]|nr:response regulator [Bryobacteraceae bacterium]